MKKFRLILIMPVMSILFSCYQDTGKRKGNVNEQISTENLNARDSLIISKEQKILGQLIGRDVISLNDIIPDLDSNTTNIVFIISQYDCNSCLSAGYEIMEQLGKSKGVINTYSVGLTKQVKIPPKYNRIVYEDNSKKLHAELNYAPLPILLVLEGKKIIDLHLPEDSKSVHSIRFIKTYSY